MAAETGIRDRDLIFALGGYFLQFECSTSHFDFLPARRFLPQTLKFARAGKISNNNQSEGTTREGADLATTEVATTYPPEIATTRTYIHQI